ncbi:hypothetical protein SK128_017606 [Halocaridina rubra]|uniref:MADF domain-containing protein n=1 Tax=Halocaridina rubra TaxID=373956 RepID=A0AAN8ZWI7_HALRR
MGDFSIPKEVIREFIELYRSEPCLWRVKSKAYSDRVKKAEAYEKLIVKLREVEPEATRDTVVKKINNLRTAYRKELRKVTSSIAMGCAPDEVYVPRLWYFNLLSFLNDQDISDTPVSNFCDTELKEEQDPLPCESIFIDDYKTAETPSGSETYEASSPPPPPPPPLASLPHSIATCNETQLLPHPGPSRKRLRKREGDETDYLLSFVGERLRASQPEDQFDIAGRYVAAKLRNLPRDQCIYAEKFIHEILFEAELGNLSKGTLFSTEPS